MFCSLALLSIESVYGLPREDIRGGGQPTGPVGGILDHNIPNGPTIGEGRDNFDAGPVGHNSQRIIDNNTVIDNRTDRSESSSTNENI